MSRKNMKKDNHLRDRIDKILSISELNLIDQNDLAVKAGILPNTLAQAITRGSLGPVNVGKLHDTFGINPAYLKFGTEPIISKKVTSVSKPEQADILDNPLIQSYVRELQLLRELNRLLKDENDRLRGK